MDFERAKIKALFFDFPVEHAVKVIREGKGGFVGAIPQIARWREQAFTITELEALKRQILSGQMKDDAENLLRMLQEVSRKFLTMVDDKPRVCYEHLLRWQDIVSMLGEDMLVVPYVANKDVEGGMGERTDFMWPDVLHHTNENLNTILDQGLTDVHAHFHASVDVFHLNWIAMMNGKEISALGEMVRQHLKVYQEQCVRIPNHDDPNIKGYSEVNMVVAAAYIRMKLWKMLNGYGKPSDVSIQTINDILCNRAISERIMEHVLQDDIASLSKITQKDNQGERLDYAITRSAVAGNENNIFHIYNGERGFLYKLFYRLQKDTKSIKAYMPAVYLYLLMKNHIRRFFVQNNTLVGFENFQIYQKWKSAAVQKSPIGKHHAQYVLQITVQDRNKDHLEGRIAIHKDNYYDFSRAYRKLFNECTSNVLTGKTTCSIDQLSIVYHFIKSGDYSEGMKRDDKKGIGIGRYASYRQEIKDECERVVALYKQQRTKYNKYSKKIPKLTGIDAAGKEMYCRPEVFAHVYRYCRKKGLTLQTYHVGEDFLDLVDGMRAIDEAVLFLELDENCRLGHVLALGTDAAVYYKSRRFHSLLPRQNYLDDCVWLIMRGRKWAGKTLTQTMSNELMREARRMYEKIGYGSKRLFNIETYWHSMLLRGTDMEYIKGAGHGAREDWKRTAHQQNEEVIEAVKDKRAVELYINYHRSEKVRKSGIEVEDVKWPLRIIEVVKLIQNDMRKMMAKRGIAIETNPTSNYKIGRFDKYDELPLFQFYPVSSNKEKPVICTSINTDDRGVFATSIEREYSLICRAMEKMRYMSGKRMFNEGKAQDYIKKIRMNGEDQCFK